MSLPLMLPVLGAAIHSSSELPLGAYTYSRYAHLALHRMLLVLVASEVLWYSVLGYHLHHSTWCTEHPYATHSLPESVHMLVCLGSHYLYISFSQLLIRMHTMYDVYNAAPACIIYSYSYPPQRVYIRPPLSWSVLYSTASLSSSPCMCTTYLYTYYVCAPVYYTVHAPYHYVVLCRILHVTTCAPKYTYTIHISTSITYHLVCHHLISILMIHVYHHLRYLLHGICHSTLCSIYATLPRIQHSQIPCYGMSIWTSIPPQDIYISSYPQNPWNPWNP